MKGFFGYIRVSTVRQGVQGVSLVEQKDAIERHAIRRGISIAQWFEERESAATVGRPVFDRMVRLLKAGKADGVVIHKIDRSARNMLEWGYLTHLLDLTELGVDVQSATDNIDLKTRAGRLTADMLAVVAADYSRNLREEVRKGFYGRLKQGLYPLPAPIGYTDRGRGKPKEEDPVQGPLTRKAFELYGTGRYSQRHLLGTMARLGLRNRSGKPLSLNGLSVMLNNPFYMGLIRIRASNETFEGIHKAIVSKALFDRVQQILRGRTQIHDTRHEFLFRRLFKCSECRYVLTAELQKGNVYYRCHTRTCQRKGTREESIGRALSNALAPLEFSEQYARIFQPIVVSTIGRWKEQAAAERNSSRLRVAELNDKIGRLTDAFVDQVIERDLFVSRKEWLLREKRAAEENLETAKVLADILPERLKDFFELVTTASTLYEMGFPEEKREMVQIVTSNRIVTPQNVVVELSIPFREVANTVACANGAPYRGDLRTFEEIVPKLVEWVKNTPEHVHEQIRRFLETHHARRDRAA